MTDSTLTSPVAAGTALATDVLSNVHIPKNLLVNAARETVNPATSEDIADVVAALEAGSFPTDLATEATLAAVLAKLIAAPATEAGQASLLGAVDGVEAALASVLAKIIAAPATEAKQDATNTALGALATQTTLAAVLAKMIAAPATEAKQDAIIAKLIASPATEATAASLLAQLRPATSHIAITANATAIAGGPVRRLVIGGAGNITVTANGVSVQYAVVAGQQLDIAATHVTAATATGIVGQF